MSEDASLWVLFASSFLAATVLPGGSEAALVAVLRLHPDSYWPALAVATLGNTAGGMSSYLLGRMLPAAERALAPGRTSARAIAWARRFGAPVLLAAWVPILGDPLCVAAGWLRLPWAAALLYMALGKLGRYVALAMLAA